MLKLLPIFVRFTSPLLPTPNSSTWDPVPLPNSLPQTKTASPMATSFGILISPRGLPGSSLTRPLSAVESQRSSSSSSSSWPYGSPSDTTGKPTKRLATPSSMSFFFSPQGIIGNKIITGSTRLLPTPAPLQGIPACRRLSPHQFPFVNKGMKDTPASSLGSSFSTRPPILNTPASLPAICPASLPCTSQQIGPVSGKFPGLPPGQGCHMLTPMRPSAPSVSNPPFGAPAAESQHWFEPQPRGLAFPPDAVSAIVDRLEMITPQ